MTAEVLFGGTFDPPHRGHLVLIHAIQRALPQADLVLLPCYQPVHKGRSHTAASDRLAMLRRFVAPLSGVRVSTHELDAGRPVYTWETLSWRRQEKGPDAPLLFAMGGDSYAHLGRWQQWQRLPELAHLLVFDRPGYSGAADPAVETALAGRWLDWEQRQRLVTQPAGLALRLAGAPAPWSSTGLRRLPLDWDAAIPVSVLDYIRINQLYSD